MSIKNFLVRKMLKNQGVPEDQIDTVLSLMEKNPELFKVIALEVQEEMKKGKDQMTATMEVMQKYEQQLKDLAS